jgi:NitT/TauT family transport system substrate-binding protein
MDKVRLQLKWVAQAQFAGYYAAKEKGFYADHCVEVTIRAGGPDIVPETVVASGSAEFGLDWLPSLLSAREQGTTLQNIAQVFQRSAMREIAFKDTGIKGPADLKGRKVAVWFGGNEFELLTTLNKYGIDPKKDVQLIQQPFDMNLLLNRQVDAAAAMTYNEYYQVISTGVKPEDLVVIDFNAEGTAMLEDGVIARQDWLQNDKNKDIAVRFLAASFEGWLFCRDNARACVDIVLKQDETGVMTREHQTWMMTEINKLIWPSPECAKDIGYMCPNLFTQTANIALQFGVIKKQPDDKAYTHVLWEQAIRFTNKEKATKAK